MKIPGELGGGAKSLISHRWWLRKSESIYKYMAFMYLLTIVVCYWSGESFWRAFFQPWELVAYSGFVYAAVYWWAGGQARARSYPRIARFASERAIYAHILILFLGIFAFTYLYTKYRALDSHYNSIWPMMTYPLMLLSNSRGKVGQSPWPLVCTLIGFWVIVTIESNRLGLFVSIQAEIWILILGILIHYISRRNFLNEQLGNVVNEVSNTLMHLPLSDSYYQEVVNLIGTRMDFPIVNLLMLDPDNPETMRVRAGFGRQKDLWSQLSIPMQNSIAGKAVMTRQSQREDDVNTCPDYFRTVGYWDTKSELSAPIYSGDKSFGVLDAQSDQFAMFLGEDEKTLNILADAVGIALAQEHAIRRVQMAIDQTWEKLSELDTEDEIFRWIAGFIGYELKADLISCHSANIGTFWPKSPPYIWPEEDNPKEQLGYVNRAEVIQPQRVVQDSVTNMFALWETYIQPDSRNDHLINSRFRRSTNDQRSSFVETENISSTAFLPLGTEDLRLGGIFVNFHERHEFTKLEISMLKALAQAAVPQLLRVKKRLWLYEGFDRPELNIHDLLQDHRSKLMICIDDIRTHPKRAELREQRLNEMVEEIASASRKFLLAASGQRPNYGANQLGFGLQSVSRSLTRASRKRYIAEVSSSIESLNTDTKLVLYRLGSEAMNNVGRYERAATWCKLNIFQANSEIILDVTHDGVGFDPGKVIEGRFGIFYLIKLVKAHMDATVEWFPEVSTQKTRLRIRIPSLPRQEELFK